MKTKFSACLGSLGLLTLSVFLAGCFLGGNAARVTLLGNDLSLVDVTDATSYSRAVQGLSRSVLARGKPVPGNLKIILRAQVDPPTAPDGSSMQASHIALAGDGKTAFVVYMLQGSASCGGLDVIDVSNPSSPRILSTQLFPDGDLAAVTYDGSTIFMGGSKSDSAGNAWVVAMPYSAGKLGTQKEAHLPGYFATGLAVNGSSLYVTTGTTYGGVAAGLYVLDSSTLSVTASDTSGLDDLRSVAIVNGNPAGFTAQWPTASPTHDPTVRTYGSPLLTTPTDLVLTGYSAQAEAKSWMATIGSYLFVACNLSGVAVMDCTSTLTKVASIPAPSLDPAIVPQAMQSSNAVSSGSASSKTLYFIANGEAGLWVGDTASILDTSSTPGNGVAGSLRFGPGQSVNYVAGRNSVVVAAAGTGGLMIMELTQ